MKLAAFLYPTGYHVAAWRHRDVPANAGVSLRHYIEMAQLAERNAFDFIFLPDSLAVRGDDLSALSRTAIRYIAQFEPLTLLGALSSMTRRVGLVASASTTYYEPYHVARLFASLDHLSDGRAGWNLVTSQNRNESYNFGLDAHPPHAERYARAREFATVVKGLWDSWDDDAFRRDKESGVFFDPAKLHRLDHHSERFEVRGPLNIPRAPQGYPVIVQAGSSEAGRALAAETAEVVFTAQATLEDAQAFYADVKSRAAAVGREPAEIVVMPGIFPFVGRTQEEADRKHAELQELIDPIVGLSLLAGELGEVDLAAHPVDGPLPPLPESNAGKSRRDMLVGLARRDGLTIRELYERVAGSRGHLAVVGTPQRVADAMQQWFEEGGADGFNIMPPAMPGGLEDFMELVVPELRRRSLFRADYEGVTLREHLGLRRPGCRKVPT